MPSYERLDFIADSYTPLLAIAALVFIATALMKRRWRAAGVRVLGLISVLLVAYGFMFVDEVFKLWSFAGLDYSTHTAVACALAAYLTVNIGRWRSIWIISLVLYLFLMLYQRYHTIADIASTIAVVGLPMIYCSVIAAKLEKRGREPRESQDS